MDREHRLVVIGDGDTGAAAAHRLARHAGARVLVLDAAAAAPDPAGPATVVRADLAHPDDARSTLAPAAHQAWRDLERLSGQPLLVRTDGVVLAGRDRPEVGRLAAVADRHGVDFRVLDALALTRRWPRLRPGPDDHALVTPASGLLDATRAAAAHRALAAAHGVEVRRGAPVRALRSRSGYVEVVLDGEVVRADRVVVAAGSGTRAVLGGLQLPLPLAEHPQQTARHTTSCPLDFAAAHFPVFSWHGPGAVGPDARFDGVGTHGDAATRLTGRGSGATAAARSTFLDAHLPGFAAGAEHAEPPRAVTALTDGTMALGVVPGASRVVVAVGTGRHPEFAGVVGRALADLALAGQTRVPVAPFALAARVGRATGPAGAAGRSR